MEISIKMPGGKETITHRSMCIVCVEEEIFIFYDPFFDGQARMEAIGDIRWGSIQAGPWTGNIDVLDLMEAIQSWASRVDVW